MTALRTKALAFLASEHSGFSGSHGEALQIIGWLAREPVIKTCGDCAHVVYWPATGTECAHPRRVGALRGVDADAPPPPHCPLRGEVTP